MKKSTNKPAKLSKFEKRVEERHRRQEAEYGRDEFLFGAADDDEEADVEFDEEEVTTSRRGEKYYADEAGDDRDDETDYADVDDAETESAPQVGERTEMIAAEIVEAEMASLAAEMSADVEGDSVETANAGEPDGEGCAADVEPDMDIVEANAELKSEPASTESAVGSETMNISAAILAETEREIAEASAFEDEDEPEGEDEDFDFYSMSETAEIEAAAVAREMYHRPERERTSKPKVHKDKAKRSNDSGSVREMKSEAKSAKASEKYAKSTAKSAKASAKYAKSAAKSAKAEAKYEKSAAKYERSAGSSGKSSKSSSRKDRDRRRRGGFFGGIADFFSNMTMGDRLLVVTGVCVLITAVVTGVIFANTQTIRKQVASFDTVGASTDGIYIVGENGLNAVVAARAGYSAVQEEPEEIIEEEEPEEIVIEEKGVTIVMKVSSVQSDLKIKFANKSTDKLISGIPFEVTVTSDSGKEYNWTDENKDGLMYHTEVPNGTYNVSMKPLEGPEYEDYVMPADVKGVKVTDTIAYKKVDVADEVKTEAEVNVAQEDTAVQDTAIESQLKDTVEWVESTKTLISGSEEGWTEVPKNQIAPPSQTGRLRNNRSSSALMASSYRYNMPVYLTQPDEITASGGGTVNVNESIPVSVSGVSDSDVAWIAGDSAIATLSGSGTSVSVTGVSAGSYTLTATVSYTDDAGTSGTKTLTWSITVNDPSGGSAQSGDPSTPSTPTVDRVEISGNPSKIYVDGTGSLSATVYNTDGNPDSGGVTWESSAADVLTVDQSGNIKGISAGTANITATSKTDNTKSKSCSITVEAKEVPKEDISFSLKPSSVSVKVGATAQVSIDSLKGTSDTGVNWSIGDTSIATVDSSGNVKGVKVGETTLTATLNVDPNKKQSIKVSVLSSVDPNAALTYNGQQLYYKDGNGGYKEARISDYDKYDAFYIKGGTSDAQYKYTGWQTINGATFFYDKDGNYVTGEQVIQGAKYTFSSDGHLQAGSGTMGIDVSKWNGNIDWNAVRNSGVSYVIIRCGYRGSTTGALIEDPKFRANIKGAKAAGIAVGAYFFTQAVNEVEAVEEASMAIGLCSGYGLSLPIFLDVEHSGGRGDSIDAGTRTAVCKAFCNTVRNSGYGAGIYANKTWFTSYMNASQLTGYKIWLAQYAATPTYTATRYDYWQYTSKGSVAGISGNVDMNIRY